MPDMWKLLRVRERKSGIERMLLYRNHCIRPFGMAAVYADLLVDSTEFFGVEGRAFVIKLPPDLIEFNRDHDAFSFHQLAENISDLLQQAVLLIKQPVPFGCFVALDDSCPGFDPLAFELAAHIARRDSHAQVIADSLHFARISERVDVQHAP